MYSSLGFPSIVDHVQKPNLHQGWCSDELSKKCQNVGPEGLPAVPVAEYTVGHVHLRPANAERIRQKNEKQLPTVFCRIPVPFGFPHGPG